MLDPHAPSGGVHAPSDPFPIHGRSPLEGLRLEAGVIHRRLLRIADVAALGGVPEVEELDRVATAVHELHGRILELTGDPACASIDDVVATRRSIHRSLEIVQGVAEEVLAS
jgi:hypothetical protein